MKKETLLALTQARAGMYRFLAGIYLMEVDEVQLRAMQRMVFPQISGTADADRHLAEGYAQLQQSIDETDEQNLDELAADYARVFLAAGEATGTAAFPYASVYLDRKHQVGGSMEQEMKARYLARGLEPNPAVYRTMYDHIGLILEFMAVLCEEQATAVSEENVKQAASLVTEQQTLLMDALSGWVTAFTDDVIRLSALKFYPAVAKITNAFVQKEAAYLRQNGCMWDCV